MVFTITRSFKTDHGIDAGGRVLRDRDPASGHRKALFVPQGFGLLTHRRQLFGRAIAAIGMAALQHGLRHLDMACLVLVTEKRGGASPSRPSQLMLSRMASTASSRRSCTIRVLDAQQKLAAVMARIQPVEQGLRAHHQYAKKPVGEGANLVTTLMIDKLSLLNSRLSGPMPVSDVVSVGGPQERKFMRQAT